MKEVWDAIVVGGGQAGLASGYHLQKNGLRFLILEANGQAVGSWPNYYDSLKLFSPARFSSLPGLKFPGAGDHYPLRDEVIRYLQKYAKQFRLPIQTHQRVESVEKTGETFTIRTVSGDRYESKTVINATGAFQHPYMPVIKGREKFRGNILHSSEYRNPIPFVNQRVLVVGAGNSAVQIAVELAEVSRTSLAILRPVKFVKQRILGRDLHFWIRAFGFDTFPIWRFGDVAPRSRAVIDLGNYKACLAVGKPDQRPMFASFHAEGVIWPDGTKERVDTVIFATGYRPHPVHLKNIGALDSEGRPLQTAGISTTVPGL